MGNALPQFVQRPRSMPCLEASADDSATSDKIER